MASNQLEDASRGSPVSRTSRSSIGKTTPRVIAAIENPFSDANIETGIESGSQGQEKQQSSSPVPGCSGTSRQNLEGDDESSESSESENSDDAMLPHRKKLATMSNNEMRLELKYFRQKYKSLHDRVPYGSQAPWIEGEAKKKRRCGECEGMFIQHDLNLFRRLNFFRQSQM